MRAPSEVDVRHRGILLSGLLSFVDMLATACAGSTLVSSALSSVPFFFTVVMIVCSLEAEEVAQMLCNLYYVRADLDNLRQDI